MIFVEDPGASLGSSEATALHAFSLLPTVFSDIASGAKTERIGLKEAIAYARKGDVLVCYKLDRVGRSLKDLIGRL